MAIQLIGSASAANWSIASAEIGFNVSSFSLTVTPEVDVPLLQIDGQVDGAAIGDPMGDLRMSGETLDLTDVGCVAAGGFATAFVPANAAAFFGRSAGGFYLKSGEVKSDRGGWQTIDVALKSHFNLA